LKLLPDVVKTGFFTENKILRLVDPVDEEGTATYAIQYFCENMETPGRYWREKPPLCRRTRYQSLQRQVPGCPDSDGVI
jgi:uncharacterized protein DUF4286